MNKKIRMVLLTLAICIITAMSLGMGASAASSNKLIRVVGSVAQKTGDYSASIGFDQSKQCNVLTVKRGGQTIFEADYIRDAAIYNSKFFYISIFTTDTKKEIALQCYDPVTGKTTKLFSVSGDGYSYYSGYMGGAYGNHLYVIINNTLYQVNTKTGASKVIKKKVDPTGLDADSITCGKYLYVKTSMDSSGGSYLYQVNMSTGKAKKVSKKLTYASVSKLGSQSSTVYLKVESASGSSAYSVSKSGTMKKVSVPKTGSGETSVVFMNGSACVYKVRDEKKVGSKTTVDETYYLYLPKLKKTIKLGSNHYEEGSYSYTPLCVEDGSNLYVTVYNASTHKETIYRYAVKTGKGKKVKTLKAGTYSGYPLYPRYMLQVINGKFYRFDNWPDENAKTRYKSFYTIP